MNANFSKRSDRTVTSSKELPNLGRQTYQSEDYEVDCRKELYSGKYQSSPDEAPSLLAWLFGKL